MVKGMKNMKSKRKIILSTILMAMVLFASLFNIRGKSEASKGLRLIVDHKDITSIAMPIVKNNRTLVPIRFVSEELGAKVTWNNDNRTVLVEKEGSKFLLKIDSKLVNYNDGEDYELSDVEPQLLNKDENGNLRTYVPLRLISNALDIGVEWKEEENSVYIDSGRDMDKEAISSVNIVSQNNNDIISGKTSLQVQSKKQYPEGSKIEFLLLEKGETSGFIIEKGKNISGKYSYTPKIKDNGDKILVARVLSKGGMYLDGDAKPVKIAVKPEVELLGVKNGDTIKTTADLSIESNFLPFYVKYEIKAIKESGDGKETLTDVNDPLGTFTWNPMMKDNGMYAIRAVAYDENNNPYYSDPVILQVDKERVLSLGGVKENMTVNKEVNLIANRNFDVSETEYLIRDVKTGQVSTLAKIPYGAYKWNPSPNDSGEKELFVRVVEKGITYTSQPVRVLVDGKAKISLEGIGPNQVITEDATLKATSNVSISNLRYVVTNLNTNEKRQISPSGANNQALYKPIKTDGSNMTIEALADYNGKTISSEKIQFKVYHGEIFGPQPIVKKDEFLSVASKMARKSYDEMGMSAALQTSQAILETGWGQSVPVDKYTGLKSNNLFGIKAKGKEASVVSNTWEVYNGITYRVDANFRAYNNMEESWKDHKEFLLNSERYEPVIDVMYDYTRAAWAIKRAGYATDPLYPIKLINLINQYNLDELDKVKI